MLMLGGCSIHLCDVCLVSDSDKAGTISCLPDGESRCSFPLANREIEKA